MVWKDLLSWLLGIISIVLTSLFFWIQLRQSIGARTERRVRANRELIDLLVTRLVLEDYFASADELHKIREGVAVRSNVDPEALASDSSVLSLLYFGVVENNYITGERRREILKRIEHGFQINPEQNVDEPSARDVATAGSMLPMREFLEWISSNSSTIGALVSTVAAGIGFSLAAAALDNWISGGQTGAQEFFKSILNYAGPIALGTVSIVIVMGVQIFERTSQQRRSLERISRRTEESSPREFERRTLDLLAKALPLLIPAARLIIGGPAEPFDALVTVSNKKVVLEVKYFASRFLIPRSVVERSLLKLKSIAEAVGASSGIIVVPNETMLRPISNDTNFRVVPLNQVPFLLRRLLATSERATPPNHEKSTVDTAT